MRFDEDMVVRDVVCGVMGGQVCEIEREWDMFCGANC
jgi:hypothetical protein